MHAFQELFPAQHSQRCPRHCHATGSQASMQYFRARSSVKYYSSSVIACRNPPGQEGSAVARRCVCSLPCKLRAPTLRCAATSLAQGNTTFDGSSGIAKVQTDSDIDDRQPSSRKNAVHDTYSFRSSSNGFYDDRSSSIGKAGAINGTHHPFEPPHASESGISDNDQYHVSSMSASSAKDRLKQDLDRERSLSSSSRAEATDGTSASEASPSTQPAASSPESPSDASSMPGEEWHPRQERLKRLREGRDGSLDDKERLRRLRISVANKGRQPWNTGRKHSPETIAKIRKRTKEAMNRPEMIAWLKLTHKPGQVAPDVRAKISLGVHMSRLRRRGLITEGMSADEIAKAVAQAKVRADAQKEAQRLQNAQAAEQRRLQRRQLSEPERKRRAAAKQQKEEQKEQQKQATQAKAELLRAGSRAKKEKAAGSRAKKEKPARGRKKHESAAAPALQAPAVSAEQAAELVAEERSRQQALQKALQAVMRLEAALSTSSATMEGLQSTGDPAALQRARYVMSNAEEQLLRAKGQVARLHGGQVPNQSLTEEEAASLARIREGHKGRPGLRRYKQALERDRQSVASTGSTAATAEPVLDVKAETFH